MQWKNCGRRVLAAIGALTCMSMAMHAQAQCVSYTAAAGPATFVPGVDDVGNHGDDVVTNIALPFPVTFYGTTYNAANVSSNGNLQFVTASIAFGNICPIPSTATQGPAIFPFWDDQRTDATVSGAGIFTTTTGVSPNQKFIIEWRTYYYGTTPAAFTQNYEIIFSEGQGTFDVVYGTTFADRASATIGCQDGAGVFTSYSCNTAGPAAGTSLRFSCVGANIAGACCNPAAGTCNVGTSATCVGAGNFQGIGSACPANCPQPGACCNVTTGVCSQTGITGCTAPSTFSGVGTACTPNPCVGACCNPTTGACTQTTAIGCASPNQFQSLGLTCTVNPCPQPPAPSNDICETVVTANTPRVPGTGGVVTGTNAQALTDGNALCTAGYRDVYFLFTPTVGGDWQFDTCATLPTFDTMISIHSACPADSSTQIACNDDSCGLLSRTNALGLTAGVQVIIRVGSYSAANLGGPFTLTVGQIEAGACCNAISGACTSTTVGAAGCGSGTSYQGQGTSCTPNICVQPPPPANDECGATNPALTVGVSISGTNVLATTSTTLTGTLCPNGLTASGGTNDVFFRFVAPATADYEANMCGSTFDTVLSVHSDCPATEAGLIGCNDDSTNVGNTACTDGGTRSRIPHLALTAGTLYTIRAAGYAGGTGAFNLVINYVDPASIGSCCVSTTCTLSDAAGCAGTFTVAGSCTPSPCGGSAGVCCRGATCTTSITSAVSCAATLVGGQTAGATFTTAAACNAAVISNSPCCYADYNKQNGITVTDIFNFLTDWFAGSPYARVGSTGGPGPLAVQNIFDFLTNWFAGGC